MRLTLPDSTHATKVDLDEVPRDLIDCTLAAEDKRFYDHGGIDLLATARATWDFLLQRHVVSGASTITQQLIKISSPPTKRQILTKIREALAARHLEMVWTKQQILTAYLNRLDYGNLRIGSAEAARFYFQKPLSDLSLGECALLAGLPQAPSRLNPLRHPQRAIARRDVVLDRLAAMGTENPSRMTAAARETLSLRPLHRLRIAPWLAGHVPISSTGHPIKTTLDQSIQSDLQRIVREETAKLKSANLRHAAVVAIDNATGELLALVSSADWKDPRGGQLNGALLSRSPGSALKPFTYLLALRQNHLTPVSILADIPTPFRTQQGLDLPKNYDRTYRGPVTLRTALACSLNIPALRELNALGGPAPLYRLLEKLGIHGLDSDPNTYGLGLTLGNAPVTLLDLTNAYAALARGGLAFPPVLFLNTDANVTEPPTERSFDPQSAYLIADILSDQTARAPAFQPGGPLDLPFQCAVKTGTSSDFRDNWCIGFTPQFTVGVWAGNFEQQPMKGLSGIAGAGPIFHRAMMRLYRDAKPTWFVRPPGLVDVSIDSRNGKLISDSAENSHLVRDIVPADRIPPAANAADYDTSGKALLDPAYAEWFGSRHNVRRHDFALAPSRLADEPLRIISPVNHAEFLLDPEIPSGSNRLRPVTNLPGTAVWTSDTLQIEPSSPEPIIHLTPGDHTIVVTDPRTQVSRSIHVRVKSL